MKKTKFNVWAAIFSTLLSLYLIYATVALILQGGFNWAYLIILPVLLHTIDLWMGKRNWFTIVCSILMLGYSLSQHFLAIQDIIASTISIFTVIQLCEVVAWLIMIVFAIVSVGQKEKRPLRAIWWIAPLLAFVVPAFYVYLTIQENTTLYVIATSLYLLQTLVVLFASLWLTFPYKKDKKIATVTAVEEATQQSQLPPSSCQDQQPCQTQPALQSHEQLLSDIDTAQQDISVAPADFNRANESLAGIVIRPEDIFPITNPDGTIALRPVNTAQPVSVLDSKVEKLLMYKDYLYRGIITEKEYAALKKRIIEE